MVKLNISKKEIEKFLKDQFDVKILKWNKDGSCEIEKDLDDLKEKEKYVQPVTVPIYIERPVRPLNPYWYWSTTDGTYTMSYHSTGGTTNANIKTKTR